EEDRFLPEGPREFLVHGLLALCWVNIQTDKDSKHGEIHIESEYQASRVPAPRRPGFLLPLHGGNRVLVGLEKELRLCDLDEGAWLEPPATIPDDNPRTIINDAEIVPGGKAIVFGTKDVQFKDPIANLYLYTVDDNRVSLLADKQTCSNGKI